MEELAREILGVLATEAGYTGGDTPGANYKQVKTGRTGHAESLKIVFDPKRLAYRHLPVRIFPHAQPDHAQPARQRHRHAIPLGDFLSQ